jgi:large subunit ribosomal protein L4
MEAIVYNKNGKESAKITLNDKVFGVNWNADLVHQVATAMMSNRRAGTAHTKDRSEVSGTGKKPWKQKGTGRARHGSKRSPIWVGGGVAHGPRSDKNYSKKLTKKMKAKALYTVLSQKLRDGQILFVDSLKQDVIKTKDAVQALHSLSQVSGFERLAGSPKKVVHIAFQENNEVVRKSYNNIPYVDMDEVRNLNVLDILNHQYVVIENPESSLKVLEAKMA